MPREPAGGERGYAGVQESSQIYSSAGPRHCPDRRDAGPGNDRGGANRRGDRPPRVRDSPHELVRPDDQPDPRRLPSLPAAAGPRAALLRPRRSHLPDPHSPCERERARPRPRGDDPEPGDPEPDPGGESAPDLLPDAGGTGEVRDANDEPVAARDVPAPGDHAGRRGGAQLRPRRIP